jgi:hypothetical protein
MPPNKSNISSGLSENVARKAFGFSIFGMMLLAKRWRFIGKKLKSLLKLPKRMVSIFTL